MKYRFVHVEIEKKMLFRVMNHTGKIKLRNLQMTDESVSFQVAYKDFENLQEILNKINVVMIRKEEQGFYYSIANVSHIRVVTVIFGVFFLILIINSLFIWNISVDGNYSYTQNQIVSFIKSLNVKEGTRISKIDCNGLERKIRKKFDDISWVCAEIKGTNLLVHVKENYISEISVKESKPYNLVAQRDAQIVSVIVRKGKCMVDIGKKVKKGELLISGVVDVTDESGSELFQDYCCADGEVIGQTVYPYEEHIKIRHYVKTNVKNWKLWLISAFDYKWFGETSSKGKDISCEEKKLKFLGDYYFPVTIQKYTIQHYERKEADYSREEAENLLNSKLLNKLAVLEQKGYKIIKKNVRIYKVKDLYVMKGEIICHEPLGKVSYIEKKEREEETTSIYERD